VPELPIAIFGDKTHVVIDRTFGFIPSWVVRPWPARLAVTQRCCARSSLATIRPRTCRPIPPTARRSTRRRCRTMGRRAGFISRNRRTAPCLTISARAMRRSRAYAARSSTSLPSRRTGPACSSAPSASSASGKDPRRQQHAPPDLPRTTLGDGIDAPGRRKTE
jgi:hypothetical protein